MATRKRTSKKKTASPSRKPSGRAAAKGGAKHAGVVRIVAPYEAGEGRDRALAGGAHVVVSLGQVRLAALPERGRRSEVQVDVTARSTGRDGEPVGRTWSSGVLYYVVAPSELNLYDVVLYDGPVHQHLSIDLAIHELELPQMHPDDAAAFAAAAAEAAAALVGPGPGASALEAFPAMLGSILRMNGDDQVLKAALSLFTREVAKPDGPRFLAEGRYIVEKLRREGDGTALVSLVLDVRALA